MHHCVKRPDKCPALLFFKGALGFLAFSRRFAVYSAKMAVIGKHNVLSVVRRSQRGLYLDGGEHGEILLPEKYIPEGAGPGHVLDVFIYLDSEDRLVATTETPIAEACDFACLKVLEVHPRMGAFLDWGLPKDLLLPFREQTPPVRRGERVVVHIHVDTKT